MAATIPTAGVTNCCTVREPIWEKYDMLSLAAIVLPVGIGEERCRRVEAERRRHRPEVLRVERQRTLDPQDQRR